MLKVPRLTYEESDDAVVIAHREELIVHTSALNASASFRDALKDVADRVGASRSC